MERPLLLKHRAPVYLSFSRWILPCLIWFTFGVPGLNKVSFGVEAASIEQYIIDSAPAAEMFDFFHVMPTGNVEVMTEWDLLLTLDQYQALYQTQTKGRSKRKALAEVNKRWTDCYVYYEITDSLNTTVDRRDIKEAIAEWEKYTCLIFKERPSHPQRIQFKDGGGCYSKLGMQDTPQPLVLAKGCRTKGTIAHEIGHAIGWIHEHMRPDRDEYIYVNFQAIDEVHHDNYRKYEPNAINTYGIPYDYTSLMHYGNSVFQGSLIARDPTYQDKLGQRQGLSFKDIKLANIMYGCAKMFCSTEKECKEEGFQMSKPYKGQKKCQCWCDSGNVNDPLILCSEREKPPIPPQPSPLPTEMPAKACIDVHKNCKIRKRLGHCMTKMALMVRLCSKTCNFCDKSKKVCMDYDKGCPIMAASGSCETPGFRNKMTDLCKASCGFCDKPPDPCEVQKEMMGDHSPSLADKSNSGLTIISGRTSTWLISLLSLLFIFIR